MLANGLIEKLVRDPGLKEALEEMVLHPLSKATGGPPTVSSVLVAKLSGGRKRVRISIEMIPMNEKFSDE